MRLYKFNTTAFGDLTLPTWNATSDLMNWSASVGIKAVSNGFVADTLSGAKNKPETLSYSGQYRLPDSESAYSTFQTLAGYKGATGTLYMGAETFQSTGTFTSTRTIEATLIAVKSTATTQELRSSTWYILTCSFSFQLLDDSWSD